MDWALRIIREQCDFLLWCSITLLQLAFDAVFTRLASLMTANLSTSAESLMLLRRLLECWHFARESGIPRHDDFMSMSFVVMFEKVA